MPFYTLRPGQQCGHAGRDLKPGEVIELPVQVGLEVREKLMPCTKDGEPLDESDPWQLAIDQAEPHEKASLEAQRPKKVVPPPPPAPEPPATVAAPTVKVVPTSGASSGSVK